MYSHMYVCTQRGRGICPEKVPLSCCLPSGFSQEKMWELKKKFWLTNKYYTPQCHVEWSTDVMKSGQKKDTSIKNLNLKWLMRKEVWCWKCFTRRVLVFLGKFTATHTSSVCSHVMSPILGVLTTKWQHALGPRLYCKCYSVGEEFLFYINAVKTHK